jgi:AraC family transcriptional regulator
MIDHAICLISRRLLRAGERISKGESSGLLSLSRLQPAIDTIHGNPERDFTLIELARLCNSSVFHFARSFSARTGSAPFRLQRTLRLQKAQQLLLEPGISVGEVAIAVGFENLSHFSRVFRKDFGCSPREYRRLHSEQVRSKNEKCGRRNGWTTTRFDFPASRFG